MQWLKTNHHSKQDDGTYVIAGELPDEGVDDVDDGCSDGDADAADANAEMADAAGQN